jgi:hypothetical protein
LDQTRSSYTNYFGIKEANIPFENLDVLNDTPLILDPHMIRVSGGNKPYRVQAVKSMDTFLESVGRRVIQCPEDSGGLLDHINEPREPRLGFSKMGCNGHAASGILAHRIWNVLSENMYALFDQSVLKRLEDLPLFVKGIDRDVTSDITARVIFSVLAKFTVDCMQRFPELRSKGVSVLKKIVWNAESKRWEEYSYELPVVNNIHIVLIPKDWCRQRLMGYAKRFFSMGALSYVQDEMTTYDNLGKLKRPTKKSLEKSVMGDYRDCSMRITRRAINRRLNLVEDFWDYVDAYHKEHAEK